MRCDMCGRKTSVATVLDVRSGCVVERGGDFRAVMRRDAHAVLCSDCAYKPITLRQIIEWEESR